MAEIVYAIMPGPWRPGRQCVVRGYGTVVRGWLGCICRLRLSGQGCCGVSGVHWEGQRGPRISRTTVQSRGHLRLRVKVRVVCAVPLFHIWRCVVRRSCRRISDWYPEPLSCTLPVIGRKCSMDCDRHEPFPVVLRGCSDALQAGCPPGIRIYPLGCPDSWSLRVFPAGVRGYRLLPRR